MNTPINPNWDELLATNSDVKGWIKITGTAVNNVVVKSYDNSYYLTHNSTARTAFPAPSSPPTSISGTALTTTSYSTVTT